MQSLRNACRAIWARWWSRREPTPARTPHAQKRKTISIDDYLASEFVVEPLRKLDCCLVSDGAASGGRHDRRACAGSPQVPSVRILGHAQAHSLSTYASPDHFDELPAARSGPKALGRAGLTPADVDVALLYDCFTIVVSAAARGLRLLQAGESGPFVEGGRIGPSGELPVNPRAAVCWPRVTGAECCM